MRATIPTQAVVRCNNSHWKIAISSRSSLQVEPRRAFLTTLAIYQIAEAQRPTSPTYMDIEREAVSW
ncbi:hypothetical protein, partial [Xanthomonas prunicola]|uniref:hypothetical protein n=1 Tax=Xanthomonas prunicola TaxID=2053930 RepID=UPI001FB0489B